ncbi:hypothetical protein A0H81_01689 [Grifola frondosa]|uniref:Aminoglycoside phosphotransferase domain-containing protein n=1 Tax=Grifola frondosa TaxID=5627 RepID=A0A1C7MPI5_GRIFR|nr:hypothetical protein A0H81_01689 [Grifola frondosa]
MDSDLEREFVSLNVNIHQAQRIVDYHRSESVPISTFQEHTRNGYSGFTPTKTYIIVLQDQTGYMLKVSLSAPSSRMASTYAPNTLATEHALLQLLSQHTDVPHPVAHALDTSLSLLPYPYLLLSRPQGIPLSHARASGKLTQRQLLQLDLRIGTYLRQMHDRVQNDWFGLPAQAHEELYSWQEAFTGLLEGMLEQAHALGIVLPYEDVRRYLSRAIGFFLFDDCEVPSLISFAGDEDVSFVDFDPAAPPESEEEIQITSLLSFSHALWGDPLLETMFLNPSDALIEGYGGPLMLFARQRTKRIWYTLFLALVVLVHTKSDEEIPGTEDSDKVKWARSTLGECIRKLRDAPCY